MFGDTELFLHESLDHGEVILVLHLTHIAGHTHTHNTL